MKAKTKLFLIFCTLFVILLNVDICFAEMKTSGVLDSIADKYKEAAKSWADIIQKHATWLFITLAAISMVWQFSQLLLKGSSIADFFGEMIRYIMFTGFFLWLLEKGPNISMDIIESLQKVGMQASGQDPITPSSIVDIGFSVLDKAVKGFTSWDISFSIANAAIAIIILMVLALVAINMLLQMCSAWVLAYAGIFFLGFGGSKWTSDMAINYFKTCLGLGASLMTMTLLIGIGTGIINNCHKQMSTTINTQELGILLVTSITLLMLVDKLPSMVAGIITGASIGSMGIGAISAGTAAGTAMALGSAAMAVHSKTSAPLMSKLGDIGANNLKNSPSNFAGFAGMGSRGSAMGAKALGGNQQLALPPGQASPSLSRGMRIELPGA